MRIERSSVTAILDPVPDSDLALYRAGVEVSLAATTDAILIGADNPLAESVLDSDGPARVFLVSRRRRHPLALRHIAAGGSLVLLKRGRRSDSIELRRGAETITALPVTPPPRRSDSAQRAQTQEVPVHRRAGFRARLSVISGWPDTRRASPPAESSA